MRVPGEVGEKEEGGAFVGLLEFREGAGVREGFDGGEVGGEGGEMCGEGFFETFKVW